MIRPSTGSLFGNPHGSPCGSGPWPRRVPSLRSGHSRPRAAPTGCFSAGVPAGSRRQSGFTLLEVLVAVTILAVAMGAVIKVASENARNAAYLRDRTHAHWVASNVMARYRAGMEEPARGTRRGAMIMAEREWYWEVEIQPRDLDVAGYSLGAVPRIQVTVRDQDDPDAPYLARLAGFLNP